MSIWKAQRASLLVVLATILLVVLAVLQYRWVGELSEFEYQRMQRNLRASSEGLARDFEREFRRIRSAFEIDRFRNTPLEIAQEYREWADSSDFPNLVSEVYWIDRNEDERDAGPSLSRLDFEAGLLEDAQWTPALMPIRERYVGGPMAGGMRGRQRPMRFRTEKVGEDSLAVVVPQEDRRFGAWALVLLKTDVLAQSFIPAMIERYFGPEGERDYDVWITEDDPGESVVFASNLAAPFSSSSTADYRREVSGVDWVISVRHQAGSLDTFVSQYRRRNLSLGVGTVLVLGVSFILLVVATRRAQWLAERQMEFVAGVSHELRTPIAGISSLSQNLADGVVGDPDHVLQYGASINHESHRLQDMVEKVLHFSAVRAGQQRYTLRPVDLQSVLEKELEIMGRYPDGKTPPFPAVEADLPPVMGDEHALRSVVRNLVTNAMKFRKEDTPITVSASRAGAEEILLSVEDRGDGIDPSDLPHIFDPFYRGKGARAGQVGGSGLGLSLVREIIKAHGGRTEVTSRPGEGSTFRVYLRIAQLQESNGRGN